jgi:hypothetical protein
MGKATIIKVDGTKQEMSHRPTLEESQKIVGGYIELVRCSKGKTLVVNEEGLLHHLPMNPEAMKYYPYSLIVGNVILLEGWQSPG